jgi:hypothetical protein
MFICLFLFSLTCCFCVCSFCLCRPKRLTVIVQTVEKFKQFNNDKHTDKQKLINL